MGDDLRAIARALDLPFGPFVASGMVGFALLVLAFAAHNTGVSVTAAVVGLAVVLVGVRAMFRPSRPFRVEALRNGTGSEYINTSRGLGGFYAVGGVVWVAVSLAAPYME